MKDIINIHGKEYETVASRVKRFREENAELSIETELIYHDQDKVIIKAMIKDSVQVRATGHAEEVRKASRINSTSAVENCETSAIGRALACFGYLGTEFASADEVAGAIAQQKGTSERYAQKKPETDKPKSELSAVMGDVITMIKNSGFDDDTMASLRNTYAGIKTIEQAKSFKAEVEKLLTIQKKFVDDFKDDPIPFDDSDIPFESKELF